MRFLVAVVGLASALPGCALLDAAEDESAEQPTGPHLVAIDPPIEIGDRCTNDDPVMVTSFEITVFADGFAMGVVQPPGEGPAAEVAGELRLAGGTLTIDCLTEDLALMSITVAPRDGEFHGSYDVLEFGDDDDGLAMISAL